MAIFMELFANLIDSVLFAYFILGYHDQTLNKNKHCIVFSIAFFLVLTISSFYTLFSNLSTILTFLLAFGLSFSIKKKILADRIIAPFLFFITVPVINVITITFMELMIGNSEDLLTYGTSARYILIVATKILLTIAIFAILKTKRHEISFKRGDLILYVLFPGVSLLVLISISNIIHAYGIKTISPLIVFSLLGIIILNFATLFLFEKITKANKEFYELEILRSQIEYEKDKYVELQNLYEHIRLIRHDFSKHITFVNQLIESKNYDKASQYINTMQNSGDINNVLIQSGNRTLDFIINSKVSNNDDIKFSIIGSVAILPNEAYDLVVLIGNMLDNAIEAARNSMERIVEIQFLATDYYQNIICRNSIDKSVLKTNPTLKTTKKNTERHGLGVKSIKKIAEKYLGLVDFYEQKGKFCVQVSLPICEIEKVANANALNIA